MVFEVGDLICYEGHDEIYEVVCRSEPKTYMYKYCYDLISLRTGQFFESQALSLAWKWKKLTPQESAHVIAELICREGSQ
jgi:hypothetical protein